MMSLSYPTPTSWEIAIEQLITDTRVGIYPHERVPQPVAIDARLRYRHIGVPHSIEGCLDYYGYCRMLCHFLEAQPHTKLVEQLLVDLMIESFSHFPMLEEATLTLAKPLAVKQARRVAVKLNWQRADYDRWCSSQRNEENRLQAATAGQVA